MTFPSGGIQFNAVPVSGSFAPRGRRAARPTIQAKTSLQDSPGSVRYGCSSCGITYYMAEGLAAACPLCEAQRTITQLRATIQEMSRAQEMLAGDLERAKAETDLLTAMRLAIETMSTNDLAFVKSVLYRWQAGRGSVALKATHGVPKGRGKKRTAHVDGFLVVFRGGEEPEAHVCDSIGGVALAGYFEEATKLVGSLKAMQTLARAMHLVMPGLVDET